jgi:hypothetical protein
VVLDNHSLGATRRFGPPLTIYKLRDDAGVGRHRPVEIRFQYAIRMQGYRYQHHTTMSPPTSPLSMKYNVINQPNRSHVTTLAERFAGLRTFEGLHDYRATDNSRAVLVDAVEFLQ